MKSRSRRSRIGQRIIIYLTRQPTSFFLSNWYDPFVVTLRRIVARGCLIWFLFFHHVFCFSCVAFYFYHREQLPSYFIRDSDPRRQLPTTREYLRDIIINARSHVASGRVAFVFPITHLVLDKRDSHRGKGEEQINDQRQLGGILTIYFFIVEK